MGDEREGLARIFRLQSVEQLPLVESVQGAGGLVHETDIRIPQKDAGDADVLGDCGVKEIGVLRQKGDAPVELGKAEGSCSAKAWLVLLFGPFPLFFPSKAAENPRFFAENPKNAVVFAGGRWYHKCEIQLVYPNHTAKNKKCV